MFAGGFDLQSACAVAGFDDSDDYAILDLLDALVRKSLLVADRSFGRARFSMLETIRQFAEEQLVAGAAAEEVRAAHARYFAGREADIFALWDSPQQRESYNWFTRELANLRIAFRWAADHGDLDLAAPIAVSSALLGVMVENYEPIAWAEELIEPARAVDHPRLASLYVMASLCWSVGRVEEAVRYSEAGQAVILGGRTTVPSGFDSWLGSPYDMIGQAERSVEWARRVLAGGHDPYALARASIVAYLMRTGSHPEPISVAKELIEAADSFTNPWAVSWALLAYGMACCDVDPTGARDAMRRGLIVAKETGNRYFESHLANVLGRLEARHGDPVAALDYLAYAIRNYHDSGSTSVIHVPLAALAALLNELERHAPAATITGFALNSLSAAWVPELKSSITHLREVLGDQTYESLARKGATMTTAAMATYAYDQIDQARTELEHPC